MLRILTNETTKLDKRMNGTFSVVYFCATGLSIGAGQNVLYFKFEEEVNSDVVGNGHFTADGYLYDIYNNTTSNFTYRPQITEEVQKLQFKNVKNVKMSFYDKDKNAINVSNWTLVLRQV